MLAPSFLPLSFALPSYLEPAHACFTLAHARPLGAKADISTLVAELRDCVPPSGDAGLLLLLLLALTTAGEAVLDCDMRVTDPPLTSAAGVKLALLVPSGALLFTFKMKSGTSSSESGCCGDGCCGCCCVSAPLAREFAVLRCFLDRLGDLRSRWRSRN